MNFKNQLTNSILAFALIFLTFSSFAQTGGAIYEVGPLMKKAKIYPISTLLPSGKVVSFGGREFNFVSGSNSELYDPIANTFSETTMNFPHDGSGVVKLRDGRYFLLGGSQDLGVAPGYASTEMYNPSTNSFEIKASMTKARMQIGAAQLNNGKVLVVGAWYNPSGASITELYDSSTNAFSTSGTLIQPRANPIVIPTNDGGAVVAGGWPSYGGSVYPSVEYYNSSTGSFTAQSNQLISNDSGWSLNPIYTRPIADCRMNNGNYLLMAYRYNPKLEYAFIVFNPATKLFSKLNTNKPLVDSLNDGGIFDYVLNKTDNMAYCLGVDSGRVPQRLALVSVDLSNGSVYHPHNTYSLPNNEYLYPTMTYMPANGKILVQGVSTSGSSYFFGTDKTYLMTPQFSVGVNKLTKTSSGLTCYPNPVSDNLYIELSSDKSSTVNIKLFDLMGRAVINDSAELGGLTNNSIRYNTAEFANGLYKLIVASETEVYTKTIIISNR